MLIFTVDNRTHIISVLELDESMGILFCNVKLQFAQR